jgi:hypothetical protein
MGKSLVNHVHCLEALVWAALTTVFCSMVMGAAAVAQVVQGAATFLGADLLALASLALRALALAYLILILLR